MEITPKNQINVGVVLAAGGATRFAEVDSAAVKCLLPVGGPAIIEHQIEHMRAMGVSRFHIVVGSAGEAVRAHLSRVCGALDVHYHRQTAKEGTARALLEVRHVVKEPFILFLGDIYVHGDRWRGRGAEILSGGADAAVLGIEDSRAVAFREGFAIVADDAGRVRRVVEKPPGAISFRRGVGAYFLTPVAFDAAERTRQSPLRWECEITDTMQLMIDEDRRVVLCEGAAWDANVNSPSELLECNKRYMRATAQGGAVSDEATVVPGATLTRSVVCRGARVEEGAALEDCVALEGARVRRGEWKEKVFGRDGIFGWN